MRICPQNHPGDAGECILSALACTVSCPNLSPFPKRGADVLLIMLSAWHSVPSQLWPQFCLGFGHPWVSALHGPVSCVAETMRKGEGREGGIFPWEWPCLWGSPPQENPVPAWPSLGCRLKHRAEGEFVRQPTQKALGCSQTRKQYLGVRKT